MTPGISRIFPGSWMRFLHVEKVSMVVPKNFTVGAQACCARHMGSVTGAASLRPYSLFILAAIVAAEAQTTDWPAYLGNEERSHYSTLAQINAANVHELKIAWTYRAGELNPSARSEMECNPLVIDGVMYA